jgi:hypothetical protein
MGDGRLLLGKTDDAFAPLQPLFRAEGGLKLDSSSLVWARPDVILYTSSGGSPKRSRLHVLRLSTSAAGGVAAAVTTAFVAEKGGGLLSCDYSPVAESAVVVHRRANAMLAEVVCVDEVDGAQRCTRVAWDGRVEYSKPCIKYLWDGRLMARLNLVVGNQHEAADIDTTRGHPVIHGMYILTPHPVINGMHTRGTTMATWKCAALTCFAHGSYDFGSSSYGGEHGIGTKDGFALDPTRRVAVVTARPCSPASDASIADRYFLLSYLPASCLPSSRSFRIPSSPSFLTSFYRGQPVDGDDGPNG